MSQLDKVEDKAVFKEVIESVYKVLGDSFNKHATITELVRHLEKSQRGVAKEVVFVLIRIGYLRKHRTDTFSWTAIGLEYAKNVLQIV